MVSIYLVERLAANVFAATYRLSINRLRSARAALILAYTGYYATMCILLALIAFAMMVAFSAILLLNNPQLYYKLAEMQWIPPIHHLFMFGTITSKEATCLRRAGRLLLRAFSPRRVLQEVRRTAEGNAVEAACLILSLMPNRIRVARIAYDLVYGATEAGLTLFLMAPLLLALLPLLCLLGVL